MARRIDETFLSEILEPVVDAVDDTDDALAAAINEAAEMLAIIGALIVDNKGKPVSGVTDDMAVTGALGNYGRMLLKGGNIQGAQQVTRTIERIRDHGPWRRPAPRTGHDPRLI